MGTFSERLTMASGSTRDLFMVPEDKWFILTHVEMAFRTPLDRPGTTGALDVLEVYGETTTVKFAMGTGASHVAPGVAFRPGSTVVIRAQNETSAQPFSLVGYVVSAQQ
jgi:hypothetical protein